MSDVVLPRDFTISIDGAPDIEVDELMVVDAIDDLFRVEVTVRSRDHELDLGGMIGARLALSLATPAGPQVIVAVAIDAGLLGSEASGVSRYRFAAASSWWLTTQRFGCRIFQNQSAVEITRELLDEYGGRIAPADIIAVAPRPREHVTQYGESDWEFVRRILADEGIAMIPRHDGKGVIALLDDTRAAARVPEPLPFVPLSEMVAGRFHVHHVALDTRAASSRVTRRDFDFERPRLSLEGAARQSAAGIELPLERYGYEVGAFRDASAGYARAERRLEEARQRVTACFDADFTLAAAAAFTLVGHARSDVNVDWLVVRCETRAQGARSSHRLHCVPLSQPHRPVLLPRPRIIGTQTAFVVGEPGREIDVDGHGRVCLKFHWDRRSDTFGTTRRVRVSQGWAGPGYGFVCLPRVGDEVVVEFLDGDPDQPLVVGRVHNGVAVAPQTLPEQQTRSTWRSRSSPGGDGFNEITLEDAAGAELVHLHAQRDAEVVVRNDARIHVGGHVDSNVKGNATGGVKGDGALTVQGDVDVTIGGNLDVTAANIDASANKIVFSAMGARVDESAAHHVSADGPFTVSAGATVFVTPLFIVMSQAISLAAAGSLIEMGERGITIKSSGPVTINGSVVKLNC